MLQKDCALFTVGSVTSAGVLADIYEPGFNPLITVRTKHNVFVAWDAHRYHGRALAVTHMVELHDMKAVV